MSSPLLFAAVMLLSNLYGMSDMAVPIADYCGLETAPHKDDCRGLETAPHKVDCCEVDLGDNGKKVYADYHGVRYTREHDGKLGRWEMYASTEKSSTGRKSLCYNADLVDEYGKHDIAAVNYPLAGTQSNLDEDYIEYQILSAKAAKIDGFFIEWGFFPHENDVLLRAMQKVAAKYDFEIGVNWCDGWLYYNWITKIYPEIDNREKKTEYMAKCYRYLADSIYSVSTAAKVKGRPVFYHFGPGATVEEYSSILHTCSDTATSMTAHAKENTDSAGGQQNETLQNKLGNELTGLRRWADWGHLENGRYIPVTHSDELDTWIEVGEIPTPWIPARVRERDAEHPYWDNYAIEDDLIEFMKPFRDSVWMSPRNSYVIKSGFAMPGMDNRGCAGWGRGHFFLIPRDEGHTYEAMWRFCMESRDSLDMMFIASWSDYTEGHEIEPTVENGYRELKTTLKYASEFKNEKCDSSGIELPLALFKLRKKTEFLADIISCDSTSGRQSSHHKGRNSVMQIERLLDESAQRISAGDYANAAKLLKTAEKQTNKLYRGVQLHEVPISLESTSESETNAKTAKSQHKETAANVKIVLNEDTHSKEIYFDEALVREITASPRYTGVISFEYKDDGQEFLFVRSETDREPAESFGVVGKLRTDGSGEWEKAVINLCDLNIAYRDGKPTFRITGKVETRNIAIKLNLFSSKGGSCPQGSCL